MDTLIRAKAPLRISFAGGGTDVPPFPEREGGLVLSATINRYAYGTLDPAQRRPDPDRVGRLRHGRRSSRRGESPIFDGKLDLVKAAIERMVGVTHGGGFDLFLHSNAPPGSGLGSSSAMMVTLIGLLAEYRRLALTDYEIAELACAIEREELGHQGRAAGPVRGDVRRLQLHRVRTATAWSSTRCGSGRTSCTSSSTTCCSAFTGNTRTADHIIEDQTARFEQAEEEALAGLRRQKELAVQMKDALLQRRLNDFGELLDEAWQAKKRMSPRISNPRIDEMYEEARRQGAIGGKVTGAGGGGFMLFYCDYRSKHRVADALVAHGRDSGRVRVRARGAAHLEGAERWLTRARWCARASRSRPRWPRTSGSPGWRPPRR